jgi:hypothetical protein
MTSAPRRTSFSKNRRANLCGKPFEDLSHVCAFVDSRDQQYEIFLPFLREGLNCGECLLNIVAAQNRADHVERLEAGGIDSDEAVADGRQKLLGFDETYLKDGRFSADAMLATIEEAMVSIQREGFPALRGFGEMHWAVNGLPGTEELIEYEARLNYLVPQFDASIVCVYDVSKFSGRVVMDVLSTHPRVILGGQIFENPYYMQPDEFLKYLATRKTFRAHARNLSAPVHIPESHQHLSPGTYP